MNKKKMSIKELRVLRYLLINEICIDISEHIDAILQNTKNGRLYMLTKDYNELFDVIKKIIYERFCLKGDKNDNSD